MFADEDCGVDCIVIALNYQTFYAPYWYCEDWEKSADLDNVKIGKNSSNLRNNNNINEFSSTIGF